MSFVIGSYSICATCYLYVLDVFVVLLVFVIFVIFVTNFIDPVHQQPLKAAVPLRVGCCILSRLLEIFIQKPRAAEQGTPLPCRFSNQCCTAMRVILRQVYVCYILCFFFTVIIYELTLEAMRNPPQWRSFPRK